MQRAVVGDLAVVAGELPGREEAAERAAPAAHRPASVEAAAAHAGKPEAARPAFRGSARRPQVGAGRHEQEEAAGGGRRREQGAAGDLGAHAREAGGAQGDGGMRKKR